jgi:hypothetical protein
MMLMKDATDSGDFEDSFSSVPHASGLHVMLALATQHNRFMDHVDITQAFGQDHLLPGTVKCISLCHLVIPRTLTSAIFYANRYTVCLLLQELDTKTMSGFLKSQGCSKVGYEESMWMTVSDGHKLLIAVHIDDFIISCAHRPTLDKFKNALLARFDGTSEGAIRTYLGCKIVRNMRDHTTVLSQKHYAEDILRTFGFSDAHPLSTILEPHSRLSKEDCDPSPDRAFHLRYRGIVDSLGYLVNMTRPDLAFAYSEVSKYVQSPGLPHMHAADLNPKPCAT